MWSLVHEQALEIGFNTDIFDTNLINLTIVIGVVVTLVGDALTSALDERRRSILSSLESVYSRSGLRPSSAALLPPGTPAGPPPPTGAERPRPCQAPPGRRPAALAGERAHAGSRERPPRRCPGRRRRRTTRA